MLLLWALPGWENIGHPFALSALQLKPRIVHSDLVTRQCPATDGQLVSCSWLGTCLTRRAAGWLPGGGGGLSLPWLWACIGGSGCLCMPAHAVRLRGGAASMSLPHVHRPAVRRASARFMPRCMHALSARLPSQSQRTGAQRM